MLVLDDLHVIGNGRYQEADQYLKQAQSQYDELEWNQTTGIGGLFTLLMVTMLKCY
jgi:hypothetical protein